MKCPKCGKEIEDGSKFCILCGSRIVEKPELNPKTPIKKKKKWIPLLITIALVLIIGTAGLLFSGVFNKEKTDSLAAFSINRKPIMKKSNKDLKIILMLKNM